VRPPASVYRVRDGDDLTGIANRFYGTPAAAGPIWNANRGRLADPEVLPIGVEIVLPPLAAVGPDGDRRLEPAATVRPDLPSPPTATDSSPWLGLGS
jgi:phage tail protein X